MTDRIENRLSIIESDIKTILTKVSSLESYQKTQYKDLDVIKDGQDELKEFRSKTKGALYIVYGVLTIISGAVLKKFF